MQTFGIRPFFTAPNGFANSKISQIKSDKKLIYFHRIGLIEFEAIKILKFFFSRSSVGTLALVLFAGLIEKKVEIFKNRCLLEIT